MSTSEPSALFLENLPQNAQQIQAAWDALRAVPVWNENLLRDLVHLSHRLAGTALTVGYSRMGNAARQLENYLKRADFHDPGCGIGIPECEKLVASLLKEIEARVPDPSPGQAFQSAQTLKNIPSLQESRSTSLVYLADDDPILVDTLTSQLRHFG